jgi:ShK domain-like
MGLSHPHNTSLIHIVSILLSLVITISAAIAEESANNLTEILVSVEIELQKDDLNESCSEWAETGECESNPDYMLKNCAASCSSPEKATAYMHPGEDFAVGAIRFAENFGVQDIPLILKIAEKLQEVSCDYIPLVELTHCSAAGKPSKPCSAGKLWKRAEDLRKAEIHDEAAADLVRALLKNGIEVDFVEKAQRSLQWALQSIQRQRERERKEAEEEAKLERRKQEEEVAMILAAERKKEYEVHFAKIFNEMAKSLSNKIDSPAEAIVNADGTIIAEGDENTLIQNAKHNFLVPSPVVENCQSTFQIIKRIPLGMKSVEILLIEARCYELQGHYKRAMSAAGKLISKAGTFGSLPNDSVRDRYSISV